MRTLTGWYMKYDQIQECVLDELETTYVHLLTYGEIDPANAAMFSTLSTEAKSRVLLTSSRYLDAASELDETVPAWVYYLNRDGIYLLTRIRDQYGLKKKKTIVHAGLGSHEEFSSCMNLLCGESRSHTHL